MNSNAVLQNDLNQVNHIEIHDNNYVSSLFL